MVKTGNSETNNIKILIDRKLNACNTDGCYSIILEYLRMAEKRFYKLKSELESHPESLAENLGAARETMRQFSCDVHYSFVGDVFYVAQINVPDGLTRYLQNIYKGTSCASLNNFLKTYSYAYTVEKFGPLPSPMGQSMEDLTRSGRLTISVSLSKDGTELLPSGDLKSFIDSGTNYDKFLKKIQKKLHKTSLDSYSNFLLQTGRSATSCPVEVEMIAEYIEHLGDQSFELVSFNNDLFEKILTRIKDEYAFVDLDSRLLLLILFNSGKYTSLIDRNREFVVAVDKLNTVFVDFSTMVLSVNRKQFFKPLEEEINGSSCQRRDLYQTVAKADERISNQLLQISEKARMGIVINSGQLKNLAEFVTSLGRKYKKKYQLVTPVQEFIKWDFFDREQ